MNYKITLSAKQRLDRIEGINNELKRQNAEDEKIIADKQQAIQARLESIAINNEYASAIKAEGMR